MKVWQILIIFCGQRDLEKLWREENKLGEQRCLEEAERNVPSQKRCCRNGKKRPSLRKTLFPDGNGWMNGEEAENFWKNAIPGGRKDAVRSTLLLEEGKKRLAIRSTLFDSRRKDSSQNFKSRSQKLWKLWATFQFSFTNVLYKFSFLNFKFAYSVWH